MASDLEILTPPSRRTWRPDLVAGAVLVVLAAATAAAGAPGFVSAPLTGVAAAVTLDRVCRRPDRTVLECLLRGAGGLVLVLMALGFLLDAAPGGLTSSSWAAGTAIVAVIALANCARRPAPPRVQLPSRGTIASGSAGYVVSAVLLGFAFAITVHATDRAERPPLALSLQSSDAGSADVAVSAGTTGGEYELLVSDGLTRPAVQGPFRVAAGSTVEHTVALPAGARVSVSLVASGTIRPLRSLVLQGPGPLRTATPATPTPKPTTPATTQQPTPSPTVAPTPAPTKTRPPVLGPASPLSTAPVLGPASLLPTQGVKVP